MSWKYAAAVQNNGPNYFAVTTGAWRAPSIAHVFDETHARLIAASPELLDACKALVEFAAAVTDELNDQDTGWYYQLKRAVELGELAIAKAQGNAT